MCWKWRTKRKCLLMGFFGRAMIVIKLLLLFVSTWNSLITLLQSVYSVSRFIVRLTMWAVDTNLTNFIFHDINFLIVNWIKINWLWHWDMKESLFDDFFRDFLGEEWKLREDYKIWPLEADAGSLFCLLYTSSIIYIVDSTRCKRSKGCTKSPLKVIYVPIKLSS